MGIQQSIEREFNLRLQVLSFLEAITDILEVMQGIDHCGKPLSISSARLRYLLNSADSTQNQDGPQSTEAQCELRPAQKMLRCISPAQSRYLTSFVGISRHQDASPISKNQTRASVSMIKVSEYFGCMETTSPKPCRHWAPPPWSSIWILSSRFSEHGGAPEHVLFIRCICPRRCKHCQCAPPGRSLIVRNTGRGMHEAWVYLAFPAKPFPKPLDT